MGDCDSQVEYVLVCREIDLEVVGDGACRLRFVSQIRQSPVMSFSEWQPQSSESLDC
jgi:hypothetical protein